MHAVSGAAAASSQMCIYYISHCGGGGGLTCCQATSSGCWATAAAATAAAVAATAAAIATEQRLTLELLQPLYTYAIERNLTAPLGAQAQYPLIAISHRRSMAMKRISGTDKLLAVSVGRCCCVEAAAAEAEAAVMVAVDWLADWLASSAQLACRNSRNFMEALEWLRWSCWQLSGSSH